MPIIRLRKRVFPQGILCVCVCVLSMNDFDHHCVSNIDYMLCSNASWFNRLCAESSTGKNRWPGPVHVKIAEHNFVRGRTGKLVSPVNTQNMAMVLASLVCHRRRRRRRHLVSAKYTHARRRARVDFTLVPFTLRPDRRRAHCNIMCNVLGMQSKHIGRSRARITHTYGPER